MTEDRASTPSSTTPSPQDPFGLLLVLMVCWSLLVLFQERPLFQEMMAQWLPFALCGVLWSVLFLTGWRWTLRALAFTQESAPPHTIFVGGLVLYGLGWHAWGLPVGSWTALSLWGSGSLLLIMQGRPFVQSGTERRWILFLLPVWLGLPFFLWSLSPQTWEPLTWIYVAVMAGLCVPLWRYADSLPQKLLMCGLALLLSLPIVELKPDLEVLRGQMMAQSPAQKLLPTSHRRALLSEVARWPARWATARVHTLTFLKEPSPPFYHALLSTLREMPAPPLSQTLNRKLSRLFWQLTPKAEEALQQACTQAPKTSKAAFWWLTRWVTRVRYLDLQTSHSRDITDTSTLDMLGNLARCLPTKRHTSKILLAVSWLTGSPSLRAHAHSWLQRLAAEDRKPLQEPFEALLTLLQDEKAPRVLAYTLYRLAATPQRPFAQTPFARQVWLRYLRRLRTQQKTYVRIAIMELLAQRCDLHQEALPLFREGLQATSKRIQVRALWGLFRMGFKGCLRAAKPKGTALKVSQQDTQALLRAEAATLPQLYHPWRFEQLSRQKAPTLITQLFRSAQKTQPPPIRKLARRFLLHLSGVDIQSHLRRLLPFLRSSRRADNLWALRILSSIRPLPPWMLSPVSRLLTHQDPQLQQQALHTLQQFDKLPQTTRANLHKLATRGPLVLRNDAGHTLQRQKDRLPLQDWLQQHPPLPRPQPPKGTPALLLQKDGRYTLTFIEPTTHPASHPASHTTTQNTQKLTPTTHASSQPATQKHLRIKQIRSALRVLVKPGLSLEHYKARLRLRKLLEPAQWTQQEFGFQLLPRLAPVFANLSPKQYRTQGFLLRMLGRFGPGAAPAMPLLLRSLQHVFSGPHQATRLEQLATWSTTVGAAGSPLSAHVLRQYSRQARVRQRITLLLMLGRLGQHALTQRLLRRELTAPSRLRARLAWAQLFAQLDDGDLFLVPLLLDAMLYPAIEQRQQAWAALLQINRRATILPQLRRRSSQIRDPQERKDLKDLEGTIRRLRSTTPR